MHENDTIMPAARTVMARWAVAPLMHASMALAKHASVKVCPLDSACSSVCSASRHKPPAACNSSAA